MFMSLNSRSANANFSPIKDKNETLLTFAIPCIFVKSPVKTLFPLSPYPCNLKKCSKGQSRKGITHYFYSCSYIMAIQNLAHKLAK